MEIPLYIVATCNISHAKIDLLCQTFNSHSVSRNSYVNWMPRSYNSTPLDYFLWRAVNEKHYAEKQDTIKHLKANICNAIARKLLRWPPYYIRKKYLIEFSALPAFASASALLLFSMFYPRTSNDLLSLLEATDIPEHHR